MTSPSYTPLYRAHSCLPSSSQGCVYLASGSSAEPGSLETGDSRASSSTSDRKECQLRMFPARAITSAMAATTAPVMTLATSAPAWHSTTLSALVQRMMVSVLAGGVWRVEGAAGKDGVEDAVGDLVGCFFQARGITPLAGISDPGAHRRDEQPGACDDGRQRLELAGLVGVERPQGLVDRVRGSAVELCQDGGDAVESVGAGVGGTRQPLVEVWFRGRSRVVARGWDEHIGDGTQRAQLGVGQLAGSRELRGNRQPRRRSGGNAGGHALTFWPFAFAAMCSATRSASAEMVHVGLAEPPVTKMLPSARNRFGTSWARP